MAKLLLQNKSNINEKTTEQLSCLHLALRCGREHPELIQFLIENGAGFLFVISFNFMKKKKLKQM